MRITLVSSEPIRPTMGGIGIRMLEMTRHLAALGFETRLISPSPTEESAMCGLPTTALRRFDSGNLAADLRDSDAVIAQGQLANHVVLVDPPIPVVVDLYDPWMVENLHYVADLGLDPYRNDHASWTLQMARGDVFLCASREQRLFYLGFLAALGRVNPEIVERDPGLEGLILEVPFGCAPPSSGGRRDAARLEGGEARLLFGGVYDWYDVETFVAALEVLERKSDRPWRAFVVRNPNPGSTPQRKFATLEKDCRRRGWWGERVVALEWTPAVGRARLLSDFDLLVGPHRSGLESGSRFVPASSRPWRAGCPAWRAAAARSPGYSRSTTLAGWCRSEMRKRWRGRWRRF